MTFYQHNSEGNSFLTPMIKTSERNVFNIAESPLACIGFVGIFFNITGKQSKLSMSVLHSLTLPYPLARFTFRETSFAYSSEVHVEV